MKSCLYLSLLSSVMFYGLAYGACTPSPDCASLGYTATFCPNGGVKCPFDTSKWHCNECGADYKQDCTGTGYASGAGATCGGKYAYCNCASGYEWKNGNCQTISSGICCYDNSHNDCTYYSIGYGWCKSNRSYPDCKTMQESCRLSGGTPFLRGCLGYNGLDYAADFDCIP